MFRPFLYRFFSVYLFLLFFANVAHGSSRLGTSKGGGSSVFSLFNLKEKSRFWSESVLRTGFDDLESSVPLKESMENYTKAGTIANYLKLLEVDSLYLPIPVNFIFIGFEGKGNQGFELHPEELERWFTKIDHIFQHSRIPQIGEVLTPFYKISIDREQYHHLPLISHVNFNFSAHAIQMGEKVTSIFEHAINVLSRKDDVPHTGDEEAGLWQVDVDMMATLFDSLVDYLQLQDAYNIFVLNPKRDPKRAKYGYRRGLSESEINFLKEDKALQSRILQSGSVPDSDLALDKIKRPLYAKHPMAKFSWTVTEETDTVEWYNRCLEALNNIEKLYSGKDTSNIIHGKVMKFLSGKNEDLKLLLEKNLRSGDLSGFHADCLTDMWIGKERWAFIDLSAGPFSWGPAVGGEGVRTELSLPSVDKTIGAVEEKDTTSGSSVQEAAPTSVTATNSSGGDVTSLQITSHKLNGKNFLLWSQSVLMVIRGRGKMGYLTGDIPRPATTDASYENWELNNSIVMSWLINSMEPHISRTYIFLRTAKAIWSAVKENYSDLENASQVFEIKNKLKDVRQGSLEVTEYYNLLQAWWQELDMYYEADWGDLDTNVKLKTHLEKERLYEFLAGVNRDLDEVRGRILGRRPLPSIEEAFAEVRREESRKKVMLGRQQDSEVTIVGGRPAETMALVTKRGPPDQKQRPRCSYCNKLGHTQDRCWSRHGKPADSKPRKAPFSSGLHVATEDQLVSKPDTAGLFNPGQLEQLFALLKQKVEVSGESSTGHLTHQGNMSFVKNPPWILDSGASDHMSGDLSLFHSYTSSPSPSRVKVANGTFTSVAGKGSVQLSPSRSLSPVLFVPKLACNLISVNKLCQALNCSVHFFADRCLMKEEESGKMIGIAKAKGGLYYLDNLVSSTKQAAAACSFPCFHSVSNNDVLLWHNRLGHPSFYYLKKLLPHLFHNKSLSFFQCDYCQLAKQTKATYSPQPHRQTSPFSLVHSDVWDPSRVKNVTGTRWFITFIDDHTRMCWVYLFKDKTEVATIFQRFHSMIKTQFQASLQVLRTDNGTEYFKDMLTDYLATHGIIHQSSCPDTPQQNGVAERKNRHLLEVTRALMFTMNVPKYLWGEAVLTACHLINRMPSKVLHYQTPLATLQGVYPNFHGSSSLSPKVFGCTVFVHDHSPNLSKLDPRSIKCVFIGYSSTQRGYKCYSPSLHRIFVSLNVSFQES